MSVATRFEDKLRERGPHGNVQVFITQEEKRALADAVAVLRSAPGMAREVPSGSVYGDWVREAQAALARLDGET